MEKQDVELDQSVPESRYDFTDMPLRDDNPTRIDLLGFGDIVTAVKATVTRPDLDPITVGVNAPWGGGKTTVLLLLQQQLEDQEDVLAVYVSPWEYDRTTDTKATLIGTVLKRLDDELRVNETAIAGVRNQLDKMIARVNFTKAVTLAAKTALTLTIPSVESLAGLFDPEDDKTAPTLQGFREQFDELLSSDELSHVTRVVVLVDDLDRSLPDTVVESLEAIKLFLSVKKMGFVIAADEDNVARAIGRRLESTGQPTTARQYLEKIVHIPFRIPALSRERTEEYLSLLILADAENLNELISRVAETRGSGESLAARLDDLVTEEQRTDIALAERLAPILHHHTQGNPRRLKRFLNALWLRTEFARSRGVSLEVDTCAKLMVAELLYPDLFGQMLGWLSAGNLGEKIAEIENREGEHSEQTFEWGSLEPTLATVNLAEYLFLAASLRGETVEEAALPPDLRDLAAQLTADSTVVRDGGLEAAAELDTDQRSTLARYIAAQLRHQRLPERQKALAESLSGLADNPAVAKTASVELSLMDPASILAPVPLALLAKNSPPDFIEMIRRWSEDDDMRSPTRAASAEALKGVN